MNEPPKPGQSALPTTSASPAWDPVDEGQAIVDELRRAEGGAADDEEAASRLETTIAELKYRRELFQVVWWEGADGRFQYPRWQFSNTGMMTGVAECLAQLKGSDPWAVIRFFLFFSESLDNRRPLDLLRGGQVAEAVAAARAAWPDGPPFASPPPPTLRC